MKDRVEIVKTEFLKDVSNHQAHVLHDNGVYRHLRFDNAGSCAYHFNLTTWPGYICISGDMGCFVFSRLNDMFEFFRREKLEINPWYWCEKLESISKEGYEKYSPDVFRERIKEIYSEWDVGESNVKSLRIDVSDEVLSRADYGEEAARNAAENFSFKINDNEFSFTDFFEVDLTEYTYNFLWCLYAIVWGIQQYDKAKGGGVGYAKGTVSKI